jgi:magnesium transporter
LFRLLAKPLEGSLRREEGLLAATSAIERWSSGKERVWLDLVSPTPEEVDLLLWELGFEDLSLEDATGPDQPPKVEEVGAEGPRAAYLLVVARAPRFDGAGRTENVALLMRPRLLVSVHLQQSTRVDAAMTRVARDPKQTIAKGIEFAAYALLDEFVEAYYPVLDDFDRRIEELEDALVSEEGRCSFASILALRREVAQVWRDTRPMRDLMASLAREGHPLINPKARVAFRDLYDHLQRTLDRLENHRDSISSIRDAHLSLTNNRMNEVMKTLTVVSVVGVVLSVITGVFGMNFARIPGADHPSGFTITIVGLLVLAGLIVVAFRWKRWI